jgi:hypothetical protein
LQLQRTLPTRPYLHMNAFKGPCGNSTYGQVRPIVQPNP